MANRILLPALLGSHPLGALSSFGLLRLLSDCDSSARLGFVMQDDWTAFVESEQFETIEALIAKLISWVSSPELNRILEWTDEDVRVAPELYRQALSSKLKENDLLITSFLSAYVADGAVDKQKGLIKPGAFYMVSGQQSFLRGAREIIDSVRENPEAAFDEALRGPWAYRTEIHSLGWDPNTERLHALRYKAPTSEKATCVAGAVVLGLWALPLYPSVSREGRPFTVGFTRESGEQCFAWPVFSTPIGVSTLKSLVQGGFKSWITRQNQLRRGIEACYRSRRFEFGQGYAVFRSPQVILQRGDESAGVG